MKNGIIFENWKEIRAETEKTRGIIKMRLIKIYDAIVFIFFSIILQKYTTKICFHLLKLDPFLG